MLCITSVHFVKILLVITRSCVIHVKAVVPHASGQHQGSGQITLSMHAILVEWSWALTGNMLGQLRTQS